MASELPLGRGRRAWRVGLSRDWSLDLAVARPIPKSHANLLFQFSLWTVQVKKLMSRKTYRTMKRPEVIQTVEWRI